MADRSLLFIHSPLVGPSSLQRLADLASATGFESALPNLTSAATAAHPHTMFVERAVEAAGALGSPPVIVGHSGAGVFLPAIGHALRAETVLLFLDAVLPPQVGAHRTTDAMKSLLNEQGDDDGLLARWLAWWPAEIVAELLPDEKDRESLAADMPRLHRSFYDTDVDVPDGWSEGRCAFVQLSPSYNVELDEAKTRQWPTATLDSTHLGMHTNPEAVLAVILTLVDQLA